jgi:hypothetical protein
LAGSAVVASTIMLVTLHLQPGSRGLEQMMLPISNYAFTANGWLFDVAVVVLACGLALLISALVRGGCLAGRSPARLLLSACSVGLVLVVVFPEHTLSGAVGLTGKIHWVAAMFAMGGLTSAPALLGRHCEGECSALISRTRLLGAGTAPCFLVMLVASLGRYAGWPIPIWFFSFSERAVVALDLAVAGELTAWGWRGCACRASGDVALFPATGEVELSAGGASDVTSGVSLRQGVPEVESPQGRRPAAGHPGSSCTAAARPTMPWPQ